MGDAVYGQFQFNDQIKFFREKLNLPTASWTDIWHEQHDRSFVVAGAMRDDLLDDFRSAVDKAVSQGTTLETFRKDFDAIVEKHGWEYNGGRNWRSRVIYETNLAQSYRAGRWQQIQAVKKLRPYLQYHHMPNERYPRLEHEAWDGLILPVDHFWWLTHFPQCAWGCQCWVDTLSKRDLERDKLSVTQDQGVDDFVRARWTAMQQSGRVGADVPAPIGTRTVTVGARGPTPRTVTVPVGVDPGFAYVPGRSLSKDFLQASLEKAAALPAAEAAESASEVLSIQRVAQAIDQDFSALVDKVAASKIAEGESLIVGAIEPDIIEALSAAGIEPETAPIVARDKQLLHALRDSKAGKFTASGLPKAVSAEELKLLPEILRTPKAVLLDKGSSTLIYVFDAQRREAGKVVVKVNYKTRLRTASDERYQAKVNDLVTVSLVDFADLKSQITRGELQQLKGSEL